MKLIRFKRTKTSVMGVLIGDNGDRYFTLENASTLIPDGVYDVGFTYSPKFKRILPHLYNNDVGKERGIRIHVGNTYKDSAGCILIGNLANLERLTVTKSREAVEQLVKCCGFSLQIVSE